MRSSIVIATCLLLAGRAAADDPKKPEAHLILERAIAGEKQAGVLDQALADLDALVARQPKDPDTHYARGWVLSHQGKAEPAVAAYDKAFALDGKLADAPYNAGVVLARLGKPKDASVRFDRALAADPRHVDAAYNAGQSYYDVKDFKKAAERWTTASTLAPTDFNAAKKLVQAYVALGKDAEVTTARAKVLELWKTATDPALKNKKSYVYDQLDVGKYHIYVYEAFDTGGDLAYVYEFSVTEKDKPIGSVNLETSAVIREQGVPFIMGIDKDGKHTSTGKTWKTMPTYKVVKAEATKLIKSTF
jgi:tetratricopeptide (TPR) repeat protein